MLRIQRALLLELAFVLAVVLGLTTAIVFSGLSVVLLSRAGDGLATPLLMDLLPYLLPTALGYSLPFAWLVAVSTVMGRWVNDHEVISLRAAGVHLRTLILPVLALGAVLALAGLAISLYVSPAAQAAVREATRSHVQRFLTSLKGADRSVVMGNGRLSFAGFDAGVFRDVELDRRDDQGRLELKVIARSLDLKQVTLEEGGAGLAIEFHDGYVLRDQAGTPSDVTPAPGTVLHMAQVKELGGSTLFNAYFGLTRYLARARDLDLRGLLYLEQWGGFYRTRLSDVQEAIHGRIVNGLAPLLLGLFALGVALLLPPTGRRVRDFLVAFVPATLIWFPMTVAAPGLSGALPLPLWVGMWSPVLVLGGLGAFLLLLAARR